MFLFAVLACVVAKSEPTSSAIIDVDSVFNQMRAGRKFSDIVDVRPILELGEGTASLVEFLDNIKLSEESCYTRVIAQLNVDCTNASKSLQKKVALRFTECFYQITGRPHKIPIAPTDKQKIQLMGRDVYNTYSTMRLHWMNMCGFAKQSLFNEVTSKHLINLLRSVVDSSQELRTMKGLIGNASVSFSSSVDSLQQKVDDSNQYLDGITHQFRIFDWNLTETMSIILNPIRHLENLRIGFLVFLVAFLVGIFLPEILLPGIALSIIFFALDSFIRKWVSPWDGSWSRFMFKAIFAAAYLVYPAYRVYLWISTATNVVMKISNMKKDPIMVIPRSGGVKRRLPPKRPRAF